MDPFTFALLAGGAGFGASKLSGMSTSDALKQGIFSGLTAGAFTPASAIANMTAQQGIRSLLVGGAKQALFGRLGQKAGVDPRLAMMFGSQVALPGENILRGFPTDGTQPLTAAPTQGKILGPENLPRVPDVTVDPTITGSTTRGSVMDKFSGLFKTGDQYDINKIAKGATLFGVPALLYASGAFKPSPTTMYAPSYNVNYPKLREARGGLRRIDPTSGQEVEVTRVDIPEELYPSSVPYEFTEKTFDVKKYQTGGLAQFNEGGINYLPSKTSHDESDANNYKRAGGYIEDGAGMGDKNEDTMLAQLADGEFVTRTDGVLGAGILAGANPKNEKDMREKGAKYFYEQQARFKRIFDLLNANRASKLQ
jgi:hypothetical protein